MKVAKLISGSTFTQSRDIVINYFLVDNDYNFGINDTEDVTSFKTLTAFYGVGRFNYKIYRDSLIDNILPDYLLLSNDEKRNLIYNRIFPSGTTNAALISLVGSQKELDTIFNTISEYELVDENKTTILNDLDEKLDITDFNSYTGDTSTVLSELRTDVNTISGTTNNNLTNWTFLVTNYDQIPIINGTLATGVVYDYIYDNITRFRFVPTTYDPKEDSFYSGFDGTTLTGIIISRGI